MSNVGGRDIFLVRDISRRRSRQALAVIPNTTSFILSHGNDNTSNSRFSVTSRKSVTSPDELVIQKRGRRQSIIWSPDIESVKKRASLLSFEERTPVKSSRQSYELQTYRKRLVLENIDQSYITPEKRCRTIHEIPPCLKSGFNNNNIKNCETLTAGLRELSHEQLVEMIVDLVAMHESGSLPKNEKLSEVIIKNMPIADLHSLRE